MGREISFFADYHSRENNLTNYCGLLMKMLYEESPIRFEEFLETIIKTDMNINVVPSFIQQSKMSSSIPDLAITQNSFSLFFETKLNGWSYNNDQIKRHIIGFNQNTDTKILILLSNFEEDEPDIKFNVDIQAAKKDNIIIKTLSFEYLVEVLEQVCTSDYLKNILEEFKIFLDRNDCLPSWKYLLDVVNCGKSIEEVQDGAYMCPDTGNTYSHRRAKYFGSYTNKKVNVIYQIKAIVVVDKNLSGTKIKWKNVEESDEQLIEEGINHIKKRQWRIDENMTKPMQVFLLNDSNETNFEKDSSGGMYSSKQYFFDIAKDCTNAYELAKKLDGRKWKELL